MNPASLAGLQRRTVNESAAYKRMAERTPAAHLDLGAFINSRLEHPARQRHGDETTLQAFSELNESCRQHSGVPAMGSWVPLSVLCRDLTTGNSGAVVTPSVSNEGAHSLLPQSAIVGAGATVISGLNGSNFSLPSLGAIDASSAWIADNDAAPVIEPQFGADAIVPHSLAVQITVSRRLLMNTSVDLDALLRRELAQRIAMAIDKAAIAGSGTGQPLGLLNRTDIQTLAAGTNGLAPTWQHVALLEEAVMARIGGEQARPVFVTSPALQRKLRTTARVSGQDRMIFEGSDILGYSVIASPNSPDTLTKGTSNACSALVLGSFAEAVIGFWGPAAVDILVDGRSTAGAVKIIARADVGIGVRRVGAFAMYKDLLSA